MNGLMKMNNGDKQEFAINQLIRQTGRLMDNS
ncbi:hypothetical protein SAMN05428977_103720 [Nitrosomonas sp. Nm166]|nr:hypothetical protein SAMN05428977_103720 [Nitrosomonas sp. Nm166]